MCCADFNYHINRQGIQGRKGEKGDKGFSPTINVSTDTVDEYKLIIANEDNTFETPNLRGNINVLDNGGTYLRYDKETQQISAQDMDAATASTLGGVRLSTEENITAMSADTVVTPADVADALPVYLQGEGAVSITQDVETSKTKINVDLSSVNELSTRVSNTEAEIVGIQADVASLDTDVSALKDITTSHTTSISAINDNIANLNANKVSKTDFATTETAGIVKVDGTTIIADKNGVISSVGGGATGDVTSDGDNTFTGNNTFSKTIVATGSDALLVDNRTNSWTSPQGVEFTKGNDGISHETNYNFTVADGSGNMYQAPVENVTLAASGDLILKANNNNISSNALLTSTPTIKDGDGNIILSQGNVTAGDNITIENTARGIKINGNADSYTKSETDILLSEKNDNIFDISKFTIVGSPTITEDGVLLLDGTNNRKNSVRCTVPEFNTTKPFKLYFPFKGVTAPNASPAMIYLLNDSLQLNYTANSNIVVFLRSGTSETYWDILSDYTIVPAPIVLTKKDILLVIEFTGSGYTFGYIVDGIYKEQGHIDTTSTIYNSNLFNIGWNNINAPAYSGQINFKSFSINVDGKEIFNGLMDSTKPIYDAIKANNTELSEFKTKTSNDFSAVNSALNEKANLSDLALKQNTLVSGTNIKTINGQSVLGEGDITVGGSTPTNMVTTDTVQTINASKRFYEGLTLGNPNGFRGLLSAGKLSLGDGGPANLYLKADSKTPQINFHGALNIGARSSNSSITLNSYYSNLKIATDILNFTKQDGTVVDLLNQSGGSAIIDDTTASTTTTYSSSKIDALIGNIATVLDSINGEVI